IFADVDNDGDQDLVLAGSLQPMLLVNDSTGQFTHVPDAFVFARPLQGVLTGATLADFDRDGFLDVYLCVYSYFFGAGDDTAGPTCWSPTTSARRTCTATSGRSTDTCGSKTSPRPPESSITAPA